MELKKDIDIIKFLQAIKQATNIIWLISDQGDKYNLKSTLSRYVAIDALLHDSELNLQLKCESINDEKLFINFFKQ